MHPCKWEGVICDCESVYPPQPDCPAAKDPEFEHVFGLDFGSRKPSDKRLSGTLTRRLANLPEARILYLHSNKLRFVASRRGFCISPRPRGLWRSCQMEHPRLPPEFRTSV